MKTDEVASPAEDKPTGKKRRIWKAVLGVVAAIIVIAAVYVGVSVWNGNMAPSDAAAKYDGLTYLSESEVTDYIALYREQMGLANSTDESWATFLAAYNLTPQRLRLSTIDQLIIDKLVQKKADELGLSASESEIDATVETLRSTLGLGDDEILRQTLESHGQTLEGLREVYRKAIVKRLVLSSEVETPKPTDDQVKDFMKAYDSQLANPTTRHTYCFKLNGVAESGDRDKVSLVQQLQKQFASGEKSAEAFSALVKAYSNDENLVATGGANGWDLDSSALGNTYMGILEGMKKGDVSDMFRDGDSCCFIWVDDEFTLPVESSAIEAFDLSDMPDSLRQYLSDSAAYELWEAAGDEYLDKLLAEADVVYYPMSANVPYNVDMSLADVQLEEVDFTEGVNQGGNGGADAAAKDGVAENGTATSADTSASN